MGLGTRVYNLSSSTREAEEGDLCESEKTSLVYRMSSWTASDT